MDKLRKCQSDAKIKFKEYFYEKEEDRGIISMCCGAGKTRVSYEIIKICINDHNKKFFILATSRKELLYQIAAEFTKWKKIEKMNNLHIKIVGGSGEKYPSDTLETSESIKDTIKSISLYAKNPLIIITTYQSSKKIIEAINGDDMLYPELVILDEAHNTTGENDKYNQELIKSDNDKFSSQKYLFLTATPVKLFLKNKEAPFQNKETVFSMHNLEIYGKIIYEYTFSDGIKDGIIVDFETVYYTSKDEIPENVKNELKGKNKREKQEIYFRTISSFLLDTIKDYNLKHILVYCINQEKMKIIKKWIENEMKIMTINYNIFTIISEHTKTARNNTIKQFKKYSGKPNILLSVSIFDEGIDEKCIDSVFFAEERNTESRIIQNIGRCLRTSPGKSKGIVIIPNIVYEFDEQKKINEIELSNAYSSHFKKIREVIKTLKLGIKIIILKRTSRVLKILIRI